MDFNLISAKQLYEKEIPPPEFLVKNVIEKGELIYVVGPPASFKTGWTMYLAICGAYSKKTLEFDIDKPFTTLFIDEENGLRKTKERFIRIFNGMKLNPSFLDSNRIIFSTIAGFTLTPEHIMTLTELIDKNNPDMIVIDNIARCLIGSERDEKDVSNVMRLLKPLIEAYNVTILIIHHTRKGNPQSLEDISGSRDFGAQCDNGFLLRQVKRKGNMKRFLLRQLKIKMSLEMEDINFAVEGSREEPLTIRYEGLASDVIKNLYQEIVPVIIDWWEAGSKEEYKTSDVVDAMKKKGYKDTSIRKALKFMLDMGTIEKDKFGVYKWVS